VTAGVRVRRGHDLRLTAALLGAYAGEPVLQTPVVDRQPSSQPDLFDTADAPRDVAAELDAAVATYAAQLRQVAATDRPRRFGLLVAAESAGALAAVEMTAAGIPWDVATHDAVLTELLGEADPATGRPARLAELAARVQERFGRPVNPDSPADL